MFTFCRFISNVKRIVSHYKLDNRERIWAKAGNLINYRQLILKQIVTNSSAKNFKQSKKITIGMSIKRSDKHGLHDIKAIILIFSQMFHFICY